VRDAVSVEEEEHRDYTGEVAPRQGELGEELAVPAQSTTR